MKPGRCDTAWDAPWIARRGNGYPLTMGATTDVSTDLASRARRWWLLDTIGGIGAKVRCFHAKNNQKPSTLQRSNAKAQRTFAKAHDSAAEQYGSEQRAHRVAYAAVKHSFEKVGDHWEPKERRGPSDEQAERGGLDNPLPSAEGVDANASKKHLLEIARRLEVRGRSTMTKPELVEAIKKQNRRARNR